MFNITRLIDVPAEHRDQLIAAIRSAAADCGAQRWLVEPTDPGSRNGGDILVHLRFGDERQWRCAQSAFDKVLTAPEITRVNGATYRGTAHTVGAAGTVYRTLLLRVPADTHPDTVARFEAELSSMPRYVHTIRAWQLSTVVDAIGDAAWTHVFEQEFSDVGGLMGPYLMHPIHWAVVDRWFDPETPDVIIRDRVCHSFCALPRPILRPAD